MKRITSCGLALVVTLTMTTLAMSALSATVTPASATCLKVITNEVSSWAERIVFCKKKVVGNNGYTKVTGDGILVGTAVCYKVAGATELSGWEDAKCSKAKADKGKYILVTLKSKAEEEKEEHEPGLLPEPAEKTPVSFVGKVGKTTFETKGGTKVECSKGEETGSATQLKLGTAEILYSECKSLLGVKCTGLEAKTAGSILVKGTFHLWYGFLSKEEEVLHTTITFLPNETHFSCAGTLIVLRGCVAGLLKPINEETKVLTAEFTQTKGVNDITKVLNEKLEKIPCNLETSLSGGAFEQAGAQLTEELSAFKQGGKEVSVEVMA
jgi:hypothetical protein